MTTSPITVRPLREADIPETQRIVRLAFGTQAGAPDPESDVTGADYVAPRWRMSPDSAFVAEIDGKVVGSNFATRWGSVGFFGPLTVHPYSWNQGIGQHLMKPVMDCFDRWQVTHAGLYTFSSSPKHLMLYQKYGFWPRFLTAIMTKEVGGRTTDSISRFSSSEHESVLQACSRLTNSVYPGLTVEQEIRAVLAQKLGDTVLLLNGNGVEGFAVCHCGRGTEAGENHCLIKFGAARDAAAFGRLLIACESFAASRGLSHLDAGTNLARHEAYARMLDYGFRIERQGVAMHSPNNPGYSRPGVFVMDDWR